MLKSILIASLFLCSVCSCRSKPAPSIAWDKLDRSVDTLGQRLHRRDSVQALEQVRLLKVLDYYTRARDLKDSADSIYILYVEGLKSYHQYTRAVDILRLFMRTHLSNVKDSL